ncbi:MAG TPA: peptidylprolyl isomerase [Blastocatellia bacterium]|nr:peptidylprolyl isomerase [Blastocatellia bacterium]
MTSQKYSKLCFVLLLSVFAFACNSSSPTSTDSPSAPATSSPAVKTASSPPPLAAGEEIAVLETDYGKIKLRLYSDVAPKHVENFKKLINEKFYDGTGFHRASPGFLIQGGDPNTRGNDKSRWGMGAPGQPTVPAEFNTRPYVRGTVGAARTSDPNSATSQFFICLKDYPAWNGQYTVFGEVIEGINVAEIISNAPTDEGTETLRDKATIKRAYLEKYTPK